MTYRDVLDALGIKYITHGHHHCRPGWLQMDCPYCGLHTAKYHLGVHATTGGCSCWRCGAHSVTEALTLLSNRQTWEVIKLLKQTTRTATIPEKPKTAGRMVQPKGVGPLLTTHRDYLSNRRIDCETLTKIWGVRGIGIAARLAWRLWIPITYSGRVVSWTTRSISDDVQNRYISAAPEEEEMHHKDLLYGSDYATDVAIVVEGPSDVWAIGPGAVGTFGTQVTPAQLYKISLYPVRALCFDNEPLAQQRARKLGQALSLLPGETHIIRLETGKDPSCANKQEIAELRERFLVGA